MRDDDAIVNPPRDAGFLIRRAEGDTPDAWEVRDVSGTPRGRYPSFALALAWCRGKILAASGSADRAESAEHLDPSLDWSGDVDRAWWARRPVVNDGDDRWGWLEQLRAATERAEVAEAEVRRGTPADHSARDCNPRDFEVY